MTMTWWMAALLGSGCMMTTEFINRRATGTYVESLVWTLPAILLGNWFLFRCWNGAPSLLSAWVVFSGFNCVARLAMTAVLVGEPVGWRSVLGALLVLAGGFIITTSKA